jgi:SAM-dependent methyltransferase
LNRLRLRITDVAMEARALRDFYDTPLGQRSRRLVTRALRQCWPDVRGRRLLGYGFAEPYLSAFESEAERTIAALPEAMSAAAAWHREAGLAALVQEDALPFPDAFFDLILVVHGLEEAEALRPLLRQLWRVLAPEGKLLVVAPNRASLWAQIERSPFGRGRPFSRNELNGLLRGALFVPEQWQRALYAPPIASRALTGSGAGWEKIGSRFFFSLGGVHIVEAGKSLYAPATPKPVRVTAPALLKPAGTE